MTQAVRRLRRCCHWGLNPFSRRSHVEGGTGRAMTASATAPYWLAASTMWGWDTDIQEGAMLNACVNANQTASHLAVEVAK
jgi:hypothetical protein